jgi:hypothetical protein
MQRDAVFGGNTAVPAADDVITVREKRRDPDDHGKRTVAVRAG